MSSSNIFCGFFFNTTVTELAGTTLRESFLTTAIFDDGLQDKIITLNRHTRMHHLRIYSFFLFWIPSPILIKWNRKWQRLIAGMELVILRKIWFTCTCIAAITQYILFSIKSPNLWGNVFQIMLRYWYFVDNKYWSLGIVAILRFTQKICQPKWSVSIQCYAFRVM